VRSFARWSRAVLSLFSTRSAAIGLRHTTPHNDWRVRVCSPIEGGGHELGTDEPRRYGVAAHGRPRQPCRRRFVDGLQRALAVRRARQPTFEDGSPAVGHPPRRHRGARLRVRVAASPLHRRSVRSCPCDDQARRPRGRDADGRGDDARGPRRARTTARSACPSTAAPSSSGSSRADGAWHGHPV
jgi:hypothetical protein